MMQSFFLAFSLVTCAVSGVRAVTLFEGLQNANASKFASWIQSDPELIAIFTAPNVRTVYAPMDEAVPDPNTTLSSLRARQARPPLVKLEAPKQTSDKNTERGKKGTPPDDVEEVNGPERKSNITTGEEGGFNSKRARNLPERQVVLFSGLGENVSLLRADVPYDGGFIHLVSDFFTVPQGLIATLQATNQTSFAAGLESTGLSASLSDPSGLTVFSTSNSAYEAGTANSTSSAQLSSTLSNHIVPGFKGYLPLLTDGQNLTTLGGTTLTVTVRGGEYFINEAKIVKRDLITDNGVAHVLDKVLSPPPARAVVQFTGSGWSLTPTKPVLAACIIAFLLSIGM